jgi:hypothetical protein
VSQLNENRIDVVVCGHRYLIALYGMLRETPRWNGTLACSPYVTGIVPTLLFSFLSLDGGIPPFFLISATAGPLNDGPSCSRKSLNLA